MTTETLTRPVDWTLDNLSHALRRGWTVKTVGRWTGGGLIVEPSGAPHPYWSVTDNGGELVVGKINGEPGRDVPTHWFGRPLSVWTVAYRVAMVIKGEPVDWQYEISDAEAQELLCVTGSAR